jgi:uncharacterized LabA/DUF88 family protein
LPDSKVALFIDFDNIRIGIRQHFGGELHPGKLMAKARKYGQVVTAKAYADFTGHPKEFQDKLLHAAGIEPVHAPSKVSGGRRQSSADMHIVIDIFLEAIDHPDVTTFVLMSGDADFVRMVATLRNRFGRTVVISGVQSTSTALGLMNAGDVRDPITRQDCDMTGELGRLSRPLVTRADLDAEAAAEAAQPAAAPGGFLSRLFGKRQPAPEKTAPIPSLPAPPVALPAPRRLRASELRGTPSSAGATGRSSRSSASRSSAAAPPASRAAAPAAAPPRTRGQAQRELPPVSADTRPDETEQKIIREIRSMPPGRSGYTTIKTIEETLRSRAGQLGYTRKEVPQRLERLEAMGIFRRQSRQRGSGSVDVGELNLDHPAVRELTQGMPQPAAPARAERPPRLPRPPRAPRAATAEAEPASTPVEPEAQAETPEPAPAETPSTGDAHAPGRGIAEETEAAAAESDQPNFRWVSGEPPVASPAADGSPEPAAEARPRATRARRTTPAAPRKPRAKATTGAGGTTAEAGDTTAEAGDTTAETEAPAPKPRATRSRKPAKAAEPAAEEA